VCVFENHCVCCVCVCVCSCVRTCTHFRRVLATERQESTHSRTHERAADIALLAVGWAHRALTTLSCARCRRQDSA
jgi:hypothetical protein